MGLNRRQFYLSSYDDESRLRRDYFVISHFSFKVYRSSSLVNDIFRIKKQSVLDFEVVINIIKDQMNSAPIFHEIVD